MGTSQTKEAPKKSDEELMKERWMKLAVNEKKQISDEKIDKNEKNEKDDKIDKIDKNEKIDKFDKNDKNELKKETNSIIISENQQENLKKVDDQINSSNEFKENSMEIENLQNEEEKTIQTQIDYSNKILEQPLLQPKKLDKEHLTIEKIFRISLQPSEKFVHLSIYQAQLLSDSHEEAFRLNELDNIMISIINEEEIKNKIIDYLLETYHRAIEMVDRRFRNEYDMSYQQIRKIIASYLALIIYSPENFELNISKIDTMKSLSNYYSTTDEEEIEFLISDIIVSTSADYAFMQQVFSYILNVIQMDNISSKNNFFNCERIKRNLNVLTKVLNDYPSTREAYVNEINFLPKGIIGKSFQSSTYLGVYLNLVSFESDPKLIRSSFTSLQQNEYDGQVRTYSNKLNNLMSEISNIFFILMENEKSSEMLMEYFYSLINSNLDRTKMYANPYTTSSIGFLMNTVIVLLKIFFRHEKHFIEIISEIEIMFCTSTNRINFSKCDRINPSLIKDMANNETEKYNSRSYNTTTKLFFTIHSLLSYFLKNLDDEYTKIAQQVSQMYKSNMMNDPKFREMHATLAAVDVYLKCPEFMGNLMKFNKVTSLLFFLLNNKKFNQNNLPANLDEFYMDFLKNMDTENPLNISVLPIYLVKNIMNSSLLIRKFYSEALIADMEITKLITYFAIIYSSQVDLLQNPHLRSEIFDILVYFFIINPQERNSKQTSLLLKLLYDDIIKENLIYALMRVFIDAERLGTSNQFYEKFSIRNKVLLLIENLMKTHQTIYSQKFLDFAGTYKFDAVKMINLLMNDLTYLIDECIDRLMQIKKYQDLKADITAYNLLDQESKQMEEERFNENDRRVRPEMKV